MQPHRWDFCEKKKKKSQWIIIYTIAQPKLSPLQPTLVTYAATWLASRVFLKTSQAITMEITQSGIHSLLKASSPRSMLSSYQAINATRRGRPAEINRWEALVNPHSLVDITRPTSDMCRVGCPGQLNRKKSYHIISSLSIISALLHACIILGGHIAADRQTHGG